MAWVLQWGDSLHGSINLKRFTINIGNGNNGKSKLTDHYATARL